jgi:hypothetical protein
MNDFDIRFGQIMAAAGVVALVAGAPSPAASAGALAIGKPARIEKQGVAVGFAHNFKSREIAEAAALKSCLGFKDAPADTRALCKVVKSFENACYSVALDPKNGTPGFGWAIMTNQAQADDSAMDTCRSTAGKSRARFCKITASNCDKPI